MLEDMHGEDKEKNRDIFNLILHKEEVGEVAKSWLKKYMKNMDMENSLGLHILMITMVAFRGDPIFCHIN